MRRALPRGERPCRPARQPRAPEAPLGAHATPDLSRPGPLSRRGFLQAAGVTATAVATARFARPLFRGHPHPDRRPGGSATLFPAGDRLVAEVQHVRWSIPRTGRLTRRPPRTSADHGRAQRLAHPHVLPRGTARGEQAAAE
nr:twin-arginine translocation signal domain-containing protein [Streptomyces sp. A2-16]